ncbi:hypothetical protein GCM10010404_92730 [Nonomuraea africana]
MHEPDGHECGPNACRLAERRRWHEDWRAGGMHAELLRRWAKVLRGEPLGTRYDDLLELPRFDGHIRACGYAAA